jgi:CPA2 family monovalent cation:H+ antiporter-2
VGIASDFILIIVAGLVGGLIARALRLPLLVGYVAAGVFIGPNTAGPMVVQVHDIELLAEVGVALLLFSLGLELSFQDLKPVRRIALIGGPIQILFTAAAYALLAASAFGMPTNEAIWFGAMVSVSSTVIVLKTLSATHMTSTLASRVMIGLLVVQDLAVVPMLVVLPQLGDVQHLPVNLARAIGLAVALLAALVLLGTKILPMFLRIVLNWGSRELFLIAVVVIAVGVGYITYSVGLSFALGAFVAGLVLSESEFSHQALSDVVPIRDVFGLVFFVTVGMLLSPAYVSSHIGQIVTVVALVFVGKSLIFGLLARAFGYVNMAPWIVGLGLSQIGEFSFVLARYGITSGFLSEGTYDLALSSTVITMAMSPLVSGLAPRLGRRWRGTFRAKAMKGVPLPELRLGSHVIVAGYGRSGRAIARVLSCAGIPFVIVELNHAVWAGLAAEGYSGIWGDITGEQILTAARIESAKTLLLALPDQSAILLAARRAKQLNPSITTIARSSGRSQIDKLSDAGVDSVIQPEFEGGVEMVRQVLVQYGGEAGAAELTSDIRREFYLHLSEGR